jgi:hypothetical protein
MLRSEGSGFRLMPVTITGGSAEGSGKAGYTVPKKDLMAGLTVLLEGRELRIAKGLELGEVLKAELAGMRVKVRNGGGARMEGEHDDLVIALGLACWAGRNRFGRQMTGPVGWCVRDELVDARGRII